MQMKTARRFDEIIQELRGGYCRRMVGAQTGKTVPIRPLLTALTPAFRRNTIPKHTLPSEAISPKNRG